MQPIFKTTIFDICVTNSHCLDGNCEVCGVYKAEYLIFGRAVRRLEPNGVQPWEHTQRWAVTTTGCTEHFPLIQTVIKKKKKQHKDEAVVHAVASQQ